MTVLKSIAAGIVGAVAASILWALVVVGLGLAGVWPGVISGSGGLGAVSVGFPEPFPAVIGFVVGFCWQFRRRLV